MIIMCVNYKLNVTTGTDMKIKHRNVILTEKFVT